VTRTDWLPGIVVLLVGLAAALLLVFLRRRSAPSLAAPADGAEEARLQAARLIEQLRELEVDRHQLSPEAYAREHDRLERLAADALRRRDQARTAAPAAKTKAPPAPVPSGFFGRHPQLQGALWGAGAVLFFGALGLWLSREARPRAEGEGLTGTAGRGEAAPAPPSEDPEFVAALARVRANPAEVLTSAKVVHELLRRENLDEARALTERSLGVDPFFTEARIHRAFLRALGGDEPGGAKELDHISRLYPRSHEALLFLGLLRMRSGDNAGALDAFERFLAEAPPEEQPPQMRAAIAQMRQQLRRSP
jgi:tetratricopeptide (TPR) repeat protein